MANIRVNLHYPANEEYTYQTCMERINLDEEKVYDVSHGRGFIISSPKHIKEDIKDPNGIFSTRFGRSLQDLGACEDRYRCRCGQIRGTFNEGQLCKQCGTKVKFVDDDFSYFGWIVIKEPYAFIHPSLYMSLASFIGADEFDRILNYVSKKDEDGHDVEIKKPKKEPFFGIGMIEFRERFDEIMEYYKMTKCKTQSKIDRYNDIMRDKDKIFTHSMPVFTTLLRPISIDGGDFHFEGTNAIYRLLASLSDKINKDKLEMSRNKSTKNEMLYNFQCKVKELFNEINKILSGKKGSARQLLGGRFSFSCRSVIIPSSTLRIDEVTLSYQALVGLLEQRIIGILKKAYGMHYNDAFVFLDSNRRNENEIIKQIIISIIKSYPRGIPVLINRNPTICYGSILQMYVVGIGKGYTMALPLQILRGLAADFDGVA